MAIQFRSAIFRPNGAWPPELLESELAPYWAEHDRIDVTPAARRPHHTFLEKSGERTYAVRQRIVDETGEVDWVVECTIDLGVERPDDAPLIELVRIGT